MSIVALVFAPVLMKIVPLIERSFKRAALPLFWLHMGIGPCRQLSLNRMKIENEQNCLKKIFGENRRKEGRYES